MSHSLISTTRLAWHARRVAAYLNRLEGSGLAERYNHSSLGRLNAVGGSHETATQPLTPLTSRLPQAALLHFNYRMEAKTGVLPPVKLLWWARQESPSVLFVTFPLRAALLANWSTTLLRFGLQLMMYCSPAFTQKPSSGSRFQTGQTENQFQPSAENQPVRRGLYW